MGGEDWRRREKTLRQARAHRGGRLDNLKAYRCIPPRTWTQEDQMGAFVVTRN